MTTHAKENYRIEIQRSNVTPAKFLADVRFACKQKGIGFEMSLEEFRAPSIEWNSRYSVVNGKKLCHCGDYSYEDDAANAPCAAETCVALPYKHQTYILNFDGSCFNEIIEFDFWDEKTGFGYYYQMDRDADPA